VLVAVVVGVVQANLLMVKLADQAVAVLVVEHHLPVVVLLVPQIQVQAAAVVLMDIAAVMVVQA
jgi:hypothetical protein